MNPLSSVWTFLKTRKKLWLMPSVVMILLLGGAYLLVKGISVGSFNYTRF